MGFPGPNVPDELQTDWETGYRPDVASSHAAPLKENKCCGRKTLTLFWCGARVRRKSAAPRGTPGPVQAERKKKRGTEYDAAPREALRDAMLEMDRRLAIRKKKIKNEALLGRNIKPKNHCLTVVESSCSL